MRCRGVTQPLATAPLAAAARRCRSPPPAPAPAPLQFHYARALTWAAVLLRTATTGEWQAAAVLALGTLTTLAPAFAAKLPPAQYVKCAGPLQHCLPACQCCRHALSPCGMQCGTRLHRPPRHLQAHM